MVEDDYRTATEILYIREREKLNTNGRAQQAYLMLRGENRKQSSHWSDQGCIKKLFHPPSVSSIMRHVNHKIRAKGQMLSEVTRHLKNIAVR